MSPNWTIFIDKRGLGNNVESWWVEVFLSIRRCFNSNGEYNVSNLRHFNFMI